MSLLKLIQVQIFYLIKSTNLNMKYFIKNINYFFVFFFLVFAIYLSFIGGYGADEDTLAMIGVYKGFLNGIFMTSRFTGNPVAEFGIGFLAVNFGSFITNIVTFLLFFASLLIIGVIQFKSKKKDIALFIVLALSNPFLFFDNIEPIDYSWALFFFSLGLYFYRKKKLDLSLVFFAISIGTRINFVPFVLAAILFFNEDSLKNDLKNKLLHFFGIIFVSGLFYVPVWIEHGLGFEWLRAGRTEGEFMEFIYRFTYKTIISLGLLQACLIFILLVRKHQLFLTLTKYKFEVLLIISNLLIFLWLPHEISYLQPALVFLYLLLFKLFERKFIYILVLINLSSWLVNVNFLKIEHVSKDKCDPIIAVSAKIQLSLDDGYIEKYLDTRSNIKCHINNLSKSDQQKILSGSAFSE